MSTQKLSRAFLFISFGLIVSACSQMDAQGAQKNRFQVSDVHITLPGEVESALAEKNMPVHRLGKPLEKQQNPQQEKNLQSLKVHIDKTKDGIIFQGAWKDNQTPHGQGTCYRQSKKAACHYFNGTLVHFDDEAFVKRNAAMQRCLALATKQMREKHPQLDSTAGVYKEQQFQYLDQCYKLTDTMVSMPLK